MNSLPIVIERLTNITPIAGILLACVLLYRHIHTKLRWAFLTTGFLWFILAVVSSIFSTLLSMKAISTEIYLKFVNYLYPLTLICQLIFAVSLIIFVKGLKKDVFLDNSQNSLNKQRDGARIVKYLSSILHIVLTSVFIWICWESFKIYTSVIDVRLPWYESAGIQFLAIWSVSCRLMVLIGFVYFILGPVIDISKTTRILPFATAAIIGILVFGIPSHIIEILGSVCCILAAVLSIVCAVRDLLMINNISVSRKVVGLPDSA